MLAYNFGESPSYMTTPLTKSRLHMVIYGVGGGEPKLPTSLNDHPPRKATGRDMSAYHWQKVQRRTQATQEMCDQPLHWTLCSHKAFSRVNFCRYGKNSKRLTLTVTTLHPWMTTSPPPRPSLGPIWSFRGSQFVTRLTKNMISQ